MLNREVSRRWEWRGDGQGFIGAADELKAVLSRAPTFRVLIAHGVYDLVTPYFTSVYVARQMRLDPEVRDAVRVEIYEGGHMFYTHGAPRARLHADARMLFEAASAEQRRADAAPGRAFPLARCLDRCRALAVAPRVDPAGDNEGHRSRFFDGRYQATLTAFYPVRSSQSVTVGRIRSTMISMPCRGGMDAIGLIELGLAGHAIEKERVERRRSWRSASRGNTASNASP